MAIMDRVKTAWNAFRQAEKDVDKPAKSPYTAAASSTYGGRNPSLPTRRFSSERTIISSIYTRIATDVASVPLSHVKVDDISRFEKTLDTTLNMALNFEPNMDQGPMALRLDIVATLFDKGCAAIVPVDTSIQPNENQKFDIYTLRVGHIEEWYPRHVKVSLYNEAKGIRESITLPKTYVAIVENPFGMVMNEPNSTLQRLIHKLNLLDLVDEASSSGKLDLIIQLPYVIKSEARREQAEKRREDIEFQLKGSQYGIAYTDGTEKITQLNRPAENTLLPQIETLTKHLYDQLGLTDSIMNGTADEKTMGNYENRTVKPILEAIVEAMQRSFLGVRGYRNRERIAYFYDPFKLMPISDIAEVADKFTRNEIMSSNEIRGKIGMPPDPNPKSDQLINSNMPQSDTGVSPEGAAPEAGGLTVDDMDQIMTEVFDGLTSDIEDLAGRV